MASASPNDRLRAWRPLWPFAVAALLAAGLVIVDPYLSSIVPHAVWQRLRVLDFQYKASILFPLLIGLVTWLLHQASKASDARSVSIIVLIIALQTNGIKLGPGLDLITLLPFLIALSLLAEALVFPSSRIQLSGLFFFAAFLLLLDLPHLANPLVASPVVFVANFISVLRAMMVAFVLVNLIQEERHFDLAVRTTVVVALVSASISVVQTAQSYFTGSAWTLVSEEYETKPTFLGTSQRASGLTAWPSWLADFLVMALPFMLLRLRNAETKRAALGHVLGIVLLLAGVVGTFTYASYIAFAVILLLFPFYGWPHRTIHFLVTLLFAGALFYGFGGFDWAVDRFDKSFVASAGIIERGVYLHAAMEELTRNPWWGAGFHAEQGFSENFYRKRVHNAGLQAWTNLGLMGFIVFVTMLLTLFTQLWLLALSRRGKTRQMFQALALCLTGIVVEMFAEPHLSAPLVWYYLGLCQAAILIWNRPAFPAAGRPAPDPCPAGRRPVGARGGSRLRGDLW